MFAPVNRRPARFLSAYLCLTLLVTGAEILALEIVGARLISPQFGVSLYVWSSLITVTLAALAVGYGLGGWLADRRSTPNDLFVILVVAALLMAAIPFLAPPIFSVSARLGLRAGALCSAALLVAPPLLALSMVTPYAAKLLVAIFAHGDGGIGGRGASPPKYNAVLGRLGATVGGVYALSTAGSVVGALVTGFVLVPQFSLDRILDLLALGLVMVAVLYWLATRAFGALTVVGLLLGGALLFRPSPDRLSPIRHPGFHQLFQSQSLYGDLRVVEFEETRYLVIDGIIQSGIDREGVSVFPYTHAMERLALAWHPGVDSALVIGLGAGVLPQSLRRDRVDAVDVVEIDPAVERAAERYFGYARGADRLVIDDGRRFLNLTERRYDAIFVDAFSSEALPAHLFSVEAFGAMRRHLTPDGVLLINDRELVGPGDSAAHQALARSLRALFPRVLVYGIDAGESVQSRIFVALPQSSARTPEPIDVTLATGPFRGCCIAAVPREFNDHDGLLLSDGFNPIDLLDAPAAEAMRQANRRFFQ